MEVKRFLGKLINNSFWYIRRAEVFVQSDDWKIDDFQMSDDCEPVFPASYEDFEQCRGSELIPSEWRNQFRERLEKDTYKLLIVKVGQELGYFSWITSASEHDDYIQFDSHSFSSDPYLFHCYTIEKFRGRGLHYMATILLMREFASRGKKLWGIVYSSNKTAQYVWKKAGLELTTSITIIGITNVINRKFIVSH